MGKVDSIEVNHRRTADIITVKESTDGMTVELQISQPMGTFPMQMWMGGNTIVLSQTQWKRLKDAIDKSFEATTDAGPRGNERSEG